VSHICNPGLKGKTHFTGLKCCSSNVSKQNGIITLRSSRNRNHILTKNTKSFIFLSPPNKVKFKTKDRLASPINRALKYLKKFPIDCSERACKNITPSLHNLTKKTSTSTSPSKSSLEKARPYLYCSKNLSCFLNLRLLYSSLFYMFTENENSENCISLLLYQLDKVNRVLTV